MLWNWRGWAAQILWYLKYAWVLWHGACRIPWMKAVSRWTITLTSVEATLWTLPKCRFICACSFIFSCSSLLISDLHTHVICMPSIFSSHIFAYIRKFLICFPLHRYPVPTSAETQGRTDECINKWLTTRKRDRSKIILASKICGSSERITWSVICTLILNHSHKYILIHISTYSYILMNSHTYSYILMHTPTYTYRPYL